MNDIDEVSNSSVVRAANVLICLGEGINNVTDIAERCKLSKSTVHRLLGASAPINNYFCPAAISVLGPKSRLKASAPSLTEDLKVSAQRPSHDIMSTFKW